MSSDESPQGNIANGDRRRTLSIIAAIFVGLGIIWAIFWILVFSQRERTDDAYINGNRVTISARVTGTVIAVLADNTDLVTAGQVLARLDSTDSETNLARAEAALARSVREVRQQVALSSQYDSLIASRCSRCGEARAADRRQCHRTRRTAARTRGRANGTRKFDASAAPSQRGACSG
jgi:membrane fusion protein, multidrug efflux system